jgi:conjugal transfer pilus assembly protein TrbC
MNLLRMSILAVCFASPLAQSQTSIRLPTDEEIRQAQRRAVDVLNKLPAPAVAREQTAGMPKIETIPQPAAPRPNIDAIAERYKQIAQPASEKTASDLMVFVSLSMPKGALEKIVAQAEKSGATLMFRGLKGDSMKTMTAALRDLIGSRKVSAAIHPPAFQQFSVTQVPAVVLARSSAGNVLEDGCAQADTFVKVTGDVTLDYALDYIERNSPAWAQMARSYRSKIVRGIE